MGTNCCTCVVLAVGLLAAGCSGDGPSAERRGQADSPARDASSTTSQQDAAVKPESSSESGRTRDGKLVTDTFLIDYDWDGGDLLLAIRSDLPSTTTLMVSVDRYYWEEGSSDTYSLPYLSEKSTIGAWEGDPRRVPLDDRWWRDSLQAHQRLMARVGMPFDVRAIGDSVRVGFTVPINQDDPRFGRRNKNLIGEAVRTTGLRVVEQELAFDKPVGQPPPSSHWVSRTELRPGRTYILDGPTPIMPACDPGSAEATMEAIAQVYDAEKGTAITVQEVIEGGCPDGQGSDPAYRVRVLGPDGTSVDDGWISSVALIGQSLRERDR